MKQRKQNGKSAGIERRAMPRRSWNVPAKICLNGTFLAVCVVKDISCTGARLLLDAEAMNLKEFHILLPGFKVPVKAETVWENGTLRGVRFIPNNEAGDFEHA